MQYREEEVKFLRDVIGKKKFVNIYLVNGIKLMGVIVSYDDNMIRMENQSASQLIYKHAIATIHPREGQEWQPLTKPMNTPSQDMKAA